MRILAMRRASEICAILAGSFLLLIFAAGSARAQSPVTANMDVELTILPGCRIGYDSGANGGSGTATFPSVNSLSAPVTTEATLYVLCSRNAKIAYTISMDKGQHSPSGRYTDRNLQLSADTSKGEQHLVPYKICLPGTAGENCTIWGDETAPASDIYQGHWVGTSDTPDTINFSLVVPAAKIVLYPGDYEDTVTATIKYDETKCN